MKFAILLAAAFFSTAALAQPPSSLMTKDLVGDPTREIRVLEVTSKPGASSPIHRHNGQVIVYMLSGSMVMQVKGKEPVTLTPGQTFYEDPDDIHTVGKNLSATEPAKFLAVLIVKKGAPSTVPAQ